MFPRAYPAVPISGLVASLLILLVGVFSDLGPPPPAGELLRGTVIAVERDSRGQLAALVQVDAEGGPVICGIDAAAFAGQRIPAPHTEMTVDYQPTGCALPPASRQLPRWGILALGGIGAALMVLWLRAGR
ncbi:hypothetical protein [Micromonospora sp. NPDC049679]|uniref:hypothetical protein n=1 Tax=Micromonospora sp. NPDC049679 TaxID=3155920 RepID=UPI003407E27E